MDLRDNLPLDKRRIVMSKKMPRFGRHASVGNVSSKNHFKLNKLYVIVLVTLLVVLFFSENKSSGYYLAEAIYYEARDESAHGRKAVAGVVLNRMDHKRWPNNVEAVVKDGQERGRLCDFSYQCDGLPENPWLHHYRHWPKWLLIRLEGQRYFVEHRVGLFADPTYGALYYKRKDAPSAWFDKQLSTQHFTRIAEDFGAHEFFLSND